MSTTVKIRELVLGEGLPKICVPIVGKTKEEVLDQAARILPHRPDLVEWRLDHLTEVQNSEIVKDIAESLRQLLGEMPILATFRTRKEGGEQELTQEAYISLYEGLMKEKVVDLIDVELFAGDDCVSKLIAMARNCQVTVIGSNHDFDKTPETEEIVRRLCRMQELGMDVAKMAVMPRSTADLLTLLDATRIMKEEHPETPVITMSMSGKGVLSRMAGEIFGSALTFAAVGKASAPGQVPIEELRLLMEQIHKFS